LNARIATAGETLFAQYAYPPNQLGYCGLGDGAELLEFATGERRREIRTSARGFDGAWPYLEMLASSSGGRDPLDEQVVEAYWIGNSLLEGVDSDTFAAAVRNRFSSQQGADWSCLDFRPAPVPHHGFHVFAIYPWVGLLRTGHRGAALEVLDRCRIRWGEVLQVVDDNSVDVRSQRLEFDDRRLHLGDACVERYRWQQDGHSLSGPLASGDWVSMHWDWVCQSLSEAQADALANYTRRQLDATNGSTEQ
jgi:hypothetical protein